MGCNCARGQSLGNITRAWVWPPPGSAWTELHRSDPSFPISPLWQRLAEA